MTDLVFRPAAQSDLTSIIRMLADAPLGATREDTTEPPAKVYRDVLEDIQKDARNELIVVERADQVVGCLQLTYIPGLSRKGAERAQIESVRISQENRGQGLGLKLTL